MGILGTITVMARPGCKIQVPGSTIFAGFRGDHDLLYDTGTTALTFTFLIRWMASELRPARTRSSARVPR